MATQPESEDPVVRELKEQTKWLRFLGLRELPRVVDAQLKDDTQRRAFELSDGSRSTRAIADIVGVSPKSISNWWQRWTSAGIAVADETGRATRIASLRSIGIDVAGLELPKPQHGDDDE